MGNSTALTISENNIDSYMAEVSRHPLLTRDEEMSLAYAYRDEGDVSAAHQWLLAIYAGCENRTRIPSLRL